MKHVRTQCLPRTVKNALLAGLLGGFGAVHSHAQYTFNSGSTGADGALNVTSNTTLALPANGVFNYTTITVASGAILTFTPNALNTPAYLLATGDVTINGTIDVSGSAGTGLSGGLGGPGGFNGGNPGNGIIGAGDGYGPGAGHAASATGGAGAGAYGTGGGSYFANPNHGVAYGSPLLLPLIGGSGGGGASSTAGAGGGGALLVASSTRIEVVGTILATSPNVDVTSAFGLGSGGAVRLVAPLVAGTGSLNVSGGKNTDPYYSREMHGGAGRIRIDLMDRHSLTLTCNPSSIATVGANMIVFQPNSPRLDITQVGTNTIAVGTGAPVFFRLPQNSDTNQIVQVQASNFGAVVPIRVVLTPDNGPSTSYDTNIDNTLTPASVSVPVVVPVNVQVQVNAWTR